MSGTEAPIVWTLLGLAALVIGALLVAQYLGEPSCWSS
jgi:hypothetical protein